MAYGIPGVSPNLISQQQRINALPSDPKESALAKYLIQLTQQNKVGTPEYFLAAGEFQNRQKVRQEQAAKQQQGPKVVENITAQAVQKAAPIMQGVGGLDAGAMERIDSPVYSGAMGGIVAFDDGGEVQRFQNQGLVQSPAARRGFTMFDIQNIGPTIQSSFEGMFPKEDVEAVRLREQIRELLAGRGGPYGFFKPQTDVEFARNRELAQRLNTMSLQELRQTLNNLSATGSAPSTPGIQQAENAIAAQVKAIQEGKGPHDITAAERLQAVLAQDRGTPGANVPAAAAAAAAPAAPSLASIFGQAEGIAGRLAGKAPQEITSAQGVKNVMDSLKEAGFDPEFHKKQIEEIRKEKEKTKGERSEAASLRLLEAGLGILGGESPYAFVNIGKGASPALKGFAEDIKEIKKIDRERDKAIRDLQTAEQDVKKSAGIAGLKEVSDSRARVDKYNEMLTEAKGKVFTTIYGGEVQKQIASMPGADERLYRAAQKDPGLKKTITDIKSAGFAARGDTAARTRAASDWSRSPLLQQQYPDFEDYYAVIKGPSSGGFTYLGKESQ